jgi:hypothetical protein
MILDLPRVERYLQVAQHIGRAVTLYDVHVSPYEVIFCEFEYQPSAEDGVFSLDAGSGYQPQRPRPLRIDDAAAEERLANRPEVPTRLSLLMCQKQYAHIGPRVLADQMALSGISRSLLIPVLRKDSDRDEQQRLMFDVYGDDERFGFAYCPPNPVDVADTVADIQSVAARYRLRALKVNPNIQGIDLATDEGRRRMEVVLEASRTTKLPMIVHGGISRLLKDPRCRAFARLENLLSIDWRSASVPVVICHAGLFGCPSFDMKVLMPKLEQLLSRNENVLVDISGLPLGTLCALLSRIDPERIVFGSDALYFPQWSAVVKLLFALEQCRQAVEPTFVKLAGENPSNHIFMQAQW